MKKIYVSPEIEVQEIKAANPIIAASVGVDGNKIGESTEGNPEGELDSRKNDSGWDFEW